MAPISTPETYRIYLSILVVGLFVTFGAGFLVGSSVSRDTHVIDTSPYPKNYDVAKAHSEMLETCYSYMNTQVVNMLGRAQTSEAAVDALRVQEMALEKSIQASTEALTKACERDEPKKRVTH